MNKGVAATIIVVAFLIGLAAGYYVKPSGQKLPQGAILPGKFAYPPKNGEQWTIVHGFDANYPPFTEVAPNGTAIGFDVDITNWMAKQYNWKLIHKPWDWSTIVTALEKGNLDIIASGMSITPERATTKIWFSIPYYTYIHELVVLRSDNRTEEQILNSGQYIACQRGSTSEQWADILLNKGYHFQKLALNSYVQALKALLEGRAVALITDSAFFTPYLRTHPDVAAKVKVLATLGGPETYGIATRPGDFYLRKEINDGLHTLMSSPLWDKLLHKWDLG